MEVATINRKTPGQPRMVNREESLTRYDLVEPQSLCVNPNFSRGIFPARPSQVLQPAFRAQKATEIRDRIHGRGSRGPRSLAPTGERGPKGGLMELASSRR